MTTLTQFTNNASSTLASAITTSATSIPLATGTGALFPVLSGSKFFYGTLASSSTTATEIVQVTATSADTMTVVRAQGGTTATAFASGDKFELRITAASASNWEAKADSSTLAASTGAGLIGYQSTGGSLTTVKSVLDTEFNSGGALIAASVLSAVTPPVWGSYSTAYFPIEFNLNGFPHSSTNGNNNFGTSSAITGLIDTPSTDTVWSGSINTGIAGYARSASASKGSVGVFGAGMSNVNNSQQWGANFVATNFNAASGSGAGQTAFYTCGVEADVYINGTSLTGTVIGVKIAAAISSIPSGGAYGIEIAPANVAGTLGWSVAIAIDDAPNTKAISIGSMGSGNSQSSQSVTFKSTSSSGSTWPFILFGDTSGDFNIQTSGATKLSNLKVNGYTTFSGAVNLPPLSNYASDSAAAAGGIPVNGTYRNGSVVMARVS